MNTIDKIMYVVIHAARILCGAGAIISMLAIVIGTIYPLLTPDEVMGNRGKDFWIQLGLKTLLTVILASMYCFIETFF